jgi:DnaJ like chaperone protein
VSIWARVTDALARLGGEPLSRLFERLTTPPERTVGFAIATVALGAKIAKADGLVTRNEVAAFREVFIIPEGEEGNVARVFDLARRDVAGFEEYATRIRRMFGDRVHPLADLLEGLFHIAVADGDYHPEENVFLHRVAALFELPDATFLRIRAEFVPDAERDPYDVLGIPYDATLPRPAPPGAPWCARLIPTALWLMASPRNASASPSIDSSRSTRPGRGSPPPPPRRGIPGEARHLERPVVRPPLRRPHAPS